MKKTILFILALVLSFSLGYFLNEIISKQSVETLDRAQTDNSTQFKMVSGIGGIFFKSKDPEKLKAWYSTYLGFDSNQFGLRFEWQDAEHPNITMGIQWSPFSETTNYFEPSSKEFMINYSVVDLEKLVEQLNKQGVILLDSIATYEYGKFVHLMDIEGNKIELHEPNYAYGLTEN